MMTPKHNEVQVVFPNELEEHLGVIWDPITHATEIEEANRILRSFVTDMAENRVPAVTLELLRAAAHTLGTYAGYPVDAAHMDGFFDLPQSASYRTTARLVDRFVADMNLLIEARRKASLEAPARSGQNGPVNEDEIPF